MTAAIPMPAALAQRFAAALAQQSFTASDGTAVTLDATAPQTFEQALSILSALDTYQVYLYLRDIGLEVMVTTATLNGLLPQHGKIWGVPQLGATSAVGNVVIAVSTGVTIPAGTLLTVDGSATWAVSAPTAIPANAAASVPVRATVTGITGNLAANTALTLQSPVEGVTSVVTDQNGLAGGAPIEPAENWRARIIAQIRQPFGGGTVGDYVRWATNAGAAFVKVVPGWTGLGTVGVMVAMAGGVAATPAEIAGIQAAVNAVRPVRGNVTVYAAVVTPQALTIALTNNTIANQTAIAAAMAPFYLSVGIGGTAYTGQIQAVISSVAGATNDLLAPTSDQAFPDNVLPVLGTITWQAQQ